MNCDAVILIALLLSDALIASTFAKFVTKFAISAVMPAAVSMILMVSLVSDNTPSKLLNCDASILIALLLSDASIVSTFTAFVTKFANSVEIPAAVSIILMVSPVFTTPSKLLNCDASILIALPLSDASIASTFAIFVTKLANSAVIPAAVSTI